MISEVICNLIIKKIEEWRLILTYESVNSFDFLLAEFFILRNKNIFLTQFPWKLQN